MVRCSTRIVRQNLRQRRDRLAWVCQPKAPVTLVALYRAIQLRFGYRFESCDANSPRNIGPFLSRHSPCWQSGIGLESASTRAISCCDSCDKKMLRFVCPSCTRDTDGIAAKLLRCGIASEALRRNMPLSR